MSAVSPALLRFVAALNVAPVRQPHQIAALTAQGFTNLLTPGERWLLGAVAKLPQLSEQQRARLNAIAFKVERGRK